MVVDTSSAYVEGQVAVASLTPWAGAGGTDGEREALQILAGPAVADPPVLGWRLRGLPGAGWRPTRRWLPALDLVIAAVVVLAVGAASGDSLDRGTPRTLALAGATLAWGLTLVVAGAWSASTRREDARCVVRAGVFAALACWVVDATLAPGTSAEQLFAPTVALVLATLAARVAIGVLSGPTRVVVVGDARDVSRLTTDLAGQGRGARWEAVSVCLVGNDPDEAVAALPDLPVWVGLEQVTDSARASGATAFVAVPGRSLDPVAVRRLSWAAHDAGLDILVSTGLLDVSPARVRTVSAGPVGLAQVRPATGPSPARLAKDVLDRILAGLALLAFLPLLLVIAAAVRLDSPGPALFNQRRVGRDGTTFTMRKFRTMRVDADQLLGELATQNECDDVLFKMRTDPRVTRIGALLRRYSLDELPQLVNVLRGEMSLVGPRPALPEEVAQYDDDPQHRLAVKPGLTGLWQVSGRSDLTWDESVRLDLHYVDNWSLGLDAQILVRTVGAVLGHRGAY